MPIVEGLMTGTGVPKHVQVREYVRGLLRDAEPGTAAPSERELVHQFHVARMTVRHAIDAIFLGNTNPLALEIAR